MNNSVHMSTIGLNTFVFCFVFRWWCHFDDDNYVHVVRLVELLQKFSPSDAVYLGKPSTAKPLEIFDPKVSFQVSKFILIA